jgi:multidrug efflux pump subunit AcrB
MGLIRTALRKPITVLVLVAAIFFFGVSAVRSIKIDIFPNLNLPVIYISHPYGGFTPDQMETYFGKQYVNLLLYVSGVKQIESRNIQGLTLIKLTFYEGTNMAQAAAEVTSYSTRAQASFPPGSQPPFILRFDASTLPVGQLVLSSPTRSNNELQDLANVYVRANFSSVPGLVAPAPFGGNARTVVIKADPDLLRQHNLTVDQLVNALDLNNQATPSGTVRIGDLNYFTPTNSTIATVKEFEDIPIFYNGVQNVYLKDVARVEDGADITAGYALINGKRSVYLPVTKSSTASTWQVVQDLKKALPRFQSQLPEDVKLSYEFDQSVYVINAVKNLLEEGAIGAILTGLMVLLFLGDIRGATIVIITIPVCVIAGILFLKLAGQTINIMTLSGLSLAIGILVDESTVTIENIHQHLDLGKPKSLAIWDACREIAFSKLLILFCILAVFAPAFSMSGIPGALFLPLALAIGFCMITSYMMAQTFVPVLANWMMKKHKKDGDKEFKSDEEEYKASGLKPEDEANLAEEKQKLLEKQDAEGGEGKKEKRFDKFRKRFLRFTDRMMPYRAVIVIVYAIVGLGGAYLILSHIGRDVLPHSNAAQFQVRLRAPDGTRIERTELYTLKALHILDTMVGHSNVEVTSAMVGMHGSQFSTNPIYLFMAGPQEAVLQAALKEDFKVNMDELEEDFRRHVKQDMPDLKVSFEPIELTNKILSQGSPTPIEVALSGRNKKQNEAYADSIVAKLKQLPYMRDVQIDEAIHYPAVDINIDRVRAAQLGANANEINRSLIAATSSSRFTDKQVWQDHTSNLSYFVQVQVPENEMTSIHDIGETSVIPNQQRPVLNDLASLKRDTVYGEADDLGAVAELFVTANLQKKDLGHATTDVQKAVASLGKLPRGLQVEVRGLSNVLLDTLDSLQGGLIVAIIVIYLMLAANFQSFKVALVAMSTVPAVLLGSLAILMLTGATLNLQSYMGMIMSVGVSISNSVLLVTNAEEVRLISGDSIKAAHEAAGTRLRPILMTSVAMVVGMIPMASGLGEAGDQAAPLGRAVIGGLIASTFAALFILPVFFAWVQKKTSTTSPSLDPADKESTHYIPSLYEHQVDEKDVKKNNNEQKNDEHNEK